MAKLKPSIVAVYASVFALVVVVVAIGYHEPQKTEVVANTVSVQTPKVVEATSIDEVIATDIAASVAKASNLPVASNIASLAVSTKIESSLTQLDSGKPQLADSIDNRSVTNYKVVDGDTMNSIAAKFGVSKETIKWANDMTSDSLSNGTTLKIPPVDGVLYTVSSSDTIDSIAKRYDVDKTRLILYNDLEIGGLKSGQQIILPSGTLPNTERPGYVAPVAAPTSSYLYGQGAGFGGSTWHIKYGTPMHSGNTYAYGNCTAYAYDRRVELGLPVSAGWGNAVTWAASAASQGRVVNRTPSVGAIIQNGGGFGHVAIVEKLLPNGDIQISEMNAYVAGGGFNVVSGRTIMAGNVSSYLYIH